MAASFDPSAPYQVAANAGPTPQFDPGKPFEVAPPVSGLEAANLSVQSGLTAGFNDELAGASEAGRVGLPEEVNKNLRLSPLGHLLSAIGGGASIAAEKFFGGDTALKAYEEGRDAVRKAKKAAQEQHPVIYGTGEIGGALATVPFTGGANVVSGAGIAPRIANSAITGAGYGALYGAGEGEGLGGTVTGALTGGGTGAVLGAVTPPVMEAIGAGGRMLAAPFRGAINPTREAQRQVVSTVEANTGKGSVPIVADAMERAQQHDIPLIIADTGGVHGQALADASAIKSVTARDALQQATEPRFEEQATRVGNVVKDIMGGTPNSTFTREALEVAATKANKPAYTKAYEAGADGIWSPELERLTSSPDVVAAMRDAATKGQTRAVADEFGGFNPGVKITDDGRVVFNKGATGVPTYPDLQFWDYTYRSLRDAARKEMGTSQGEAMGRVAKQMAAELDRQVPEYGQARAGAARFFGAQDATSAGELFATPAGSKLQNDEARAALAKMSGPERQLFAEAYASSKLKQLAEINPRSDVLKKNVFTSSPASIERDEMVLGKKGSDRLQAQLALETIMEKTRYAVSGNSKSIQRLADIGIASAGAGYDFAIGDPTSIGTAMIVGALLKTGRREISARVATKIGELLASGDADKLREAAQIVSSSPRLLDIVRKADNLLPRAGSPVLPTQAIGVARGNDQQTAQPGIDQRQQEAR